MAPLERYGCGRINSCKETFLLNFELEEKSNIQNFKMVNNSLIHRKNSYFMSVPFTVVNCCLLLINIYHHNILAINFHVQNQAVSFLYLSRQKIPDGRKVRMWLLQFMPPFMFISLILKKYHRSKFSKPMP